MSSCFNITLIAILLLFLIDGINCQRRRCPSSQTTHQNNSTEKLKNLRKKFSENQVQGYFIPLSDEHLSEVVADADNRLKFMTGFDGSDGLALVIDTVNGSKNIFFTDSRYGEAADEQLDCNWDLHVCRDSLKSALEWIKVNADPASRIAADVRLFNLKDWLKLNEVLQSCGHSVIPQSYNLIDDVWNDMNLKPSRRLSNETRLFIHEIEYAGKSWEEKVSQVMDEVEGKNGNSLIISSLEEVAWLLNLRGNDIDYTPIFKSYVVIISKSLVWLFVDKEKITDNVRDHLNNHNCPLSESSLKEQQPCVVIKEYKDFLWTSSDLINTVTNYYNSSAIKILIPESTNYYVFGMIPEQFKLAVAESPVAVIKSVKNEVEVNGMKSAHIRDATALVDFMARLSKAVTLGNGEQDFDQLDELSVTRLLTKIRSEQKFNRGESFPTISAVDDNAAKAHYSPTNTSSRPINVNSIYLVDSGGQYLDGTTDVTRVMVFGDEYLSSEFHYENSQTKSSRKVRGLKEVYTRILMGQIDMTTFVFPADTRARHLTDLLARRHLAEAGLMYGHGTSHGIGSYLMVHENSIYIGSSAGLNIPLKEGMFTSIEPGFYEPGSVSVRIWPSKSSGEKGEQVDGFGMRLENIVQVVEAKIPQLILDTNHGPINGREKFLTFETVTLVPYEKRLINFDMLHLTHKKWLNRYNSKIRLIVGRELKAQNRSLAFDWMMEMTEPIAEVETDQSECWQNISSGADCFVLCDLILLLVVIKAVFSGVN